MKRKAERLQELDTDRLLELRDRINEILSQHRRQIEAQLQRLCYDVRYYGQRKFRFHPKYRSKIDPNVTWSGQGMVPKWMREEMTGTNFRIVRLDVEGF